MNINAVKGALLVLLAVLIGVVVLARGLDSPDMTTTATGETGSGDATSAPPAPTTTATPAPPPPVVVTTTETTAPTTTTTTQPLPVAHSRSEVRVLVANSTDVCGAAGYQTNLLSAAGYVTKQAVNTKPGVQLDGSIAYYEPDYSADAQVIASEIGLALVNLAPMPSDLPVEDLQDAHVLVVIGNDSLAKETC